MGLCAYESVSILYSMCKLCAAGLEYVSTTSLLGGNQRKYLNRTSIYYLVCSYDVAPFDKSRQHFLLWLLLLLFGLLISLLSLLCSPCPRAFCAGCIEMCAAWTVLFCQVVCHVERVDSKLLMTSLKGEKSPGSISHEERVLSWGGVVWDA